MPYVEILAPRADTARKRELAGVVTRGIVDGFGVLPSTVTIYFQPVEGADYAHAGALGLPEAGGSRVFVKVHAYRRSPQERRAVAAAVTPALAACFDTSSPNVAVYFLDRERDEVAHDGHLASDEPASSTAD
ncbi:tautomerase family protein [Pseudorhodoferax sp.]|uniref:tautomerase family protein n=1 Tax=Pseudorhodoferax sp. TaxID=1993553 RepID=UPI0039E3B9FF